MSYGKKLFRSATRAFSSQNVYDETEEKLQSEVNAGLKNTLNDLQMKVGPYMFSLELDEDSTSDTYGALCLYLYYPDGSTPPPITLEGASLFWTY